VCDTNLDLLWVCVCSEKKKKKDLLIMTSGRGLYYIIKHGNQMRTGIDIGSSAVENNGKLPDRT
jgi:hypothetical protein